MLINVKRKRAVISSLRRSFYRNPASLLPKMRLAATRPRAVRSRDWPAPRDRRGSTSPDAHSSNSRWQDHHCPNLRGNIAPHPRGKPFAPPKCQNAIGQSRLTANKRVQA
jgi:hypothetical protein